MPNHEATSTYRKCKTAQVGDFNEYRNQRCQNITHERRHNCSKRSTDHDTDRKIDYISSKQKLFKFFKHMKRSIQNLLEARYGLESSVFGYEDRGLDLFNTHVKILPTWKCLQRGAFHFFFKNKIQTMKKNTMFYFAAIIVAALLSCKKEQEKPISYEQPASLLTSKQGTVEEVPIELSFERSSMKKGKKSTFLHGYVKNNTLNTHHLGKLEFKTPGVSRFLSGKVAWHNNSATNKFSVTFDTGNRTVTIKPKQGVNEKITVAPGVSVLDIEAFASGVTNDVMLTQCTIGPLLPDGEVSGLEYSGGNYQLIFFK